LKASRGKGKKNIGMDPGAPNIARTLDASPLQLKEHRDKRRNSEKTSLLTQK
jgi:hypothetical protein